MISSPTVLVIDDEPTILALVSDVLSSENYRILLAENAEQAIALTEKEQPHLLICDINLPDMSGMDICRMIKQKYPNIQLIFLSGLSDEMDKILGMELGAEDYITKPFNPREFKTRIRVALRRLNWTIPSDTDIHSHRLQPCPNMVIDLTRYTVTVNHQLLELTKKEFELLALLASHPGQVFTREIILNRIWHDEMEVTDRNVDVLIRRLRNKIEVDKKNPIYIETVRGFGYRFCNTDLSQSLSQSHMDLI